MVTLRPRILLGTACQILILLLIPRHAPAPTPPHPAGASKAGSSATPPGLAAKPSDWRAAFSCGHPILNHLA